MKPITTTLAGAALLTGLVALTPCNGQAAPTPGAPPGAPQQAPTLGNGASPGSTLFEGGPQKILAPDTAAGDIFAAAVHVDDDVMILAAEYDDDNGMDSGSVWVYRRTKGGVWTPEQKLKPSDAQTGDNFGRAVYVEGDRLIVGAHWDDDNGNNSGSVYVFEREGGTWVQKQKLRAPDGAADDRFGATLAFSGRHMLIGAWLEDPNGLQGAGSVYAFEHDGAEWVFAQKLVAPDAQAGNQFARYVSLEGTVACIGAWRDNDKGFQSGSAYMWRFNGTNWVMEQKLVPDDLGAGDVFGWATYTDGKRAIIGSYGDDDMAQDAGAVYVYRDDGGTWVLEQKVFADDAAAFNELGYSIAIDGSTMLLGAKITQGSANEVGIAYVFRLHDGVWKQVRRLDPPDGEPFDAFAFHLHSDGNTFVVGAWRHPQAGFQAGAGYVWTDPGLENQGRALKK